MTGSRPSTQLAVWAASEPMPDGSYAAKVWVGVDRSRVLTEAEAADYAHAVVEVATRAVHDAKVAGQLCSAGFDRPRIATVIAGLRSARPAVDPAHTAPLVLEPMLRSQTLTASVTVHVGQDGPPLGSWAPQDAESHAAGVLAVAAAARLDTSYRRALVAGGLSDTAAQDFVSLLGVIGGGR